MAACAFQALQPSRRSLLKLGSALGVTSLLPSRQARAQNLLVRSDVNSTAGQRMVGLYAQAVQKMQDPAINFPPQPQSWTFQAYIHNLPVDPFHPVESGGFRPGSPALSTRVDQIYGQPAEGTPQAAWKKAALKCWATCPHSSPWFVAWHRWYLFYFEQIVRSLSGAADFALPYWNYASDMGPSLQLPAQFQNPVLDPTNPQSPPNPLYEDLRGLGFYNPLGTGAQNLPMNDGGYLPFPATDYNPALSGAALFPSDDSTNFADLPDPRYLALGLTGRLEIQPHDNVHVNVGGLMSNVPVAAQDPVFFVHHCQIDRLWATWQSFPNATYNYGNASTAPSEQDWNNRKFSFVDASGKVVEVTTAGQLDTTKLGYKYDALAPLLPRQVVAAATPSAAARAPLVLAAAQASGLRVGSGGARVTLAPAPGTNQALASGASTPQSETLILRNVKLLSRPPAPLHVFLNLPEGTAPELLSPFHIGILNFFNWDTGTGGPMQEQVGPAGQVTHETPSAGEFRFSVGDVLARQRAEGLWNGGPITVTISTLGSDRSRDRTYVTIGQVELVP
ncbi:MAG: tyrosinase family protein [Verrucomicrobia bacterium]|nr:tyrosinase family protein [Verrucomicrobiota bacterium]